jgi:hypothetical protein
LALTNTAGASEPLGLGAVRAFGNFCLTWEDFLTIFGSLSTSLALTNTAGASEPLGLGAVRAFGIVCLTWEDFLTIFGSLSTSLALTNAGGGASSLLVGILCAVTTESKIHTLNRVCKKIFMGTWLFLK